MASLTVGAQPRIFAPCHSAARAEIYAERFPAEDGRVEATFEIVCLTGWAPHESQQQPLRPGSARARLAEALGTVEHPAGDGKPFSRRT